MTLDELAGLSLDVLMMLQDEVEIDPINPAYIGLPEAKRIALKDAGLDKEAQKVIFTKAELNSSQKEPCYFLEFYTNKNQYFYQIDAKTGDILYGREYILLENAKKIAVDDAVLRKPGRFTDEEFEKMKTHAEEWCKNMYEYICERHEQALKDLEKYADGLND